MFESHFHSQMTVDGGGQYPSLVPYTSRAIVTEDNCYWLCWKHFYTYHSHSSKLLEINYIFKLLTQCYNHSTNSFLSFISIILNKVRDRLICSVDYRIITRVYDPRYTVNTFPCEMVEHLFQRKNINTDLNQKFKIRGLTIYFIWLYRINTYERQMIHK